jgi:hypothetical protein|tara:strand:- start:124 stop:552 length:429 start_codon:yes stop_codon:yes gene_type:complete
MKKIMFSLFILSILFTIGCEDEKETSDTNPLVGVYNMTSISIELQTTPTQTLTYNHDGTDNYLVLVLGDDGVYSLQGKIDGEDGSEGGTWSDTGNKLTLIPSDGETDIFDFTLTGNNLVMTLTFPETNDEYGYVMTYNFTKE